MCEHEPYMIVALAEENEENVKHWREARDALDKQHTPVALDTWTLEAHTYIETNNNFRFSIFSKDVMTQTAETMYTLDNVFARDLNPSLGLKELKFKCKDIAKGNLRRLLEHVTNQTFFLWCINEIAWDTKHQAIRIEQHQCSSAPIEHMEFVYYLASVHWKRLCPISVSNLTCLLKALIRASGV